MSRKFLTPIQLPGDPEAPMEAATKQYVDDHDVHKPIHATSADRPPGTWTFEEMYETDTGGLYRADGFGNWLGTEPPLVGSVEPQPRKGRWFYDVDTDTIKLGDGTQFNELAAGDEVFIGPTDPIATDPTVELWYDSDAPDAPPLPDEVFIGPGDPGTTYDLWYDTDDSMLKAWVGGAWIPVSTAGGGGEEVPFAGPSAPPAPDDGELWWDTDDTTVPASPAVTLLGFAVRRAVNEAARGTGQGFQLAFDTCVTNSNFLAGVAPGPITAQAYYVVPAGGDGLYQLNAGTYWATNLTGIGLTIRVNGAAIVGSPILGTGVAQSYEIGRAWRLAAGDIIDATMYNGSAGNITVTAFAGTAYTPALPYFSAWRVAL